ncbi:hypothetical protein LPE509_02340 [Legionella pneumophila subsp. pneumophila LPE509]|nr:hypothetical protein LPE509_02340 [Legionella pneumophila subsp. pneumophila LPE509]
MAGNRLDQVLITCDRMKTGSNFEYTGMILIRYVYGVVSSMVYYAIEAYYF